MEQWLCLWSDNATQDNFLEEWNLPKRRQPYQQFVIGCRFR
ncbi:hypothetical protein O9993_12045 [Vibrio lentus]|nr:hypothetical protein [Vibrio lentus]